MSTITSPPARQAFAPPELAKARSGAIRPLRLIGKTMCQNPFQHTRWFEKGGYRPLREGYVPSGPDRGLPKAPRGGTGQTGVPKNRKSTPAKPNQ